MRTRVKLCGLTRIGDVDAAVTAGADAIGLVFYGPSRRAVSIELARALTQAVPAFVTVVGLFVNADPALVRSVLKQVSLGALQFHGQESGEYCRAFGRPWIKSVAVREGIDLAAVVNDYPGNSGLLLDTYDPNKAGGTGRCFDWDLVPASLAGRAILAGGLTPDNVADAIRKVRPYAVDVSGGIEQAKGVKDSAKIAAFMQEVANGDQSR